MIAIIGAGPVGLEAALAAEKSGRAFTIYERGQIADAVRQWGHVRMFSPFTTNSTKSGIARLRAAGHELPEPDALLTGEEFRDGYLQPLADTFGARLLRKTSVVAIGRSRRLKGDFIGGSERSVAAPFRLLLAAKDGQRVEEADVVLDCSGTFAQPNALGEGGIPAPGESECAEHIHHGIPRLTRSARYLVVGAGHSAATVVRQLAEIPRSEVTWLIRRDRETPAEEVPDDPLPERARLAQSANQLVWDGRVQLLSGATVVALQRTDNGIAVRWRNRTGDEQDLVVDEIVAATGFRPDLALTRELQLQTCWATEGTYPLAASLLGEAGADCLTTPVFGAETLLHPEPNFFTLGMKSYGRAPYFLLRTGYEQVAAVFDWLEQNLPK